MSYKILFIISFLGIASFISACSNSSGSGSASSSSTSALPQPSVNCGGSQCIE